MADYFVLNRTNPVPSTHRAGIRLSTSAVDEVGSIVAQYQALHPCAAGDVLELVPCNAFVARVASATISFTPIAVPALPPVGS
jgi:hypothetical protein